MNLAIETAEFGLIATITGRLSLEAAIHALKLVSDGAAERDAYCILLEASKVEGELSISDSYILGLTIARYCFDRRRFQKVAVVGRNTSGLEFAAKVAWNRNLCAKWFTDRQAALNWLRAFANRYLPTRHQSAIPSAATSAT